MVGWYKDGLIFMNITACGLISQLAMKRTKVFTKTAS